MLIKVYTFKGKVTEEQIIHSYPVLCIYHLKTSLIRITVLKLIKSIY